MTPKFISKQQSPEKVLDDFVSKSPTAKYTFDSERGAPQSELCRAAEGQKKEECIMIQMQSKRLFEAMQDLGFFCALPIDPTRTHMECTRMPKT
ncbi:hypothetical protein MKEN_01061100 [Mycena kentingensis (nom. inval.)]|nr:hypothetical protein MKEN_01061100 [Mycena kentingensis (nom. inval.)]